MSAASVSPVHVTAAWFRAGRVSLRTMRRTIGGDPDKAEDGSGESRGDGTKVVDRQAKFIDLEEFGEVEGGCGSVTDCDDRGGVQGSGGDEIVVRGRRDFRRSKRANVDDRSLKLSSGTFFVHFVGSGRKDANDFAEPAPGDDVVGAATGASAKDLGVRGRYINVDPVIECKSCRGTVPV
jgi:hypothetical protein